MITEVRIFRVCQRFWLWVLNLNSEYWSPKGDAQEQKIPVLGYECCGWQRLCRKPENAYMYMYIQIYNTERNVFVDMLCIDHGKMYETRMN